MKRMTEITYYRTEAAVAGPVRFAFCSDVHDGPHGEIVDLLDGIRPDAVLIGGDFIADRGSAPEAFPAACAARFPTFVSIGNHELKSGADLSRVGASGAVLLDNGSAAFRGVRIGGLTSDKKRPDLGFLDAFSRAEGFKILLCHHPEYYDRYIKKTAVDLTLSGHAHGGQWRFFGRGVFAPGQGIFPKYTSGEYDGGRLIVSRGLGDSHHVVPRIRDPYEIAVVDVQPRTI